MAEEQPNEPTEGANHQDDSKARRAYVSQADVPRHSLSEALRVPQAISDNYGKAPTKPLHIAAALELTPGSTTFKMLCGASAAYGLTQGAWNSEIISLTDLGRRIVAPTVEGSEIAAQREALLKPRIIKEFLTRYNNSKIPPEKIARNVLEEMGVAADATERTLGLILKGAKEVGFLRELKGGSYVDLDSTTPSLAEDEDERGDGPALESRQNNQDSPGERTNTGSSPAPTIAPGVAASPGNNRVFITHGRNKEIVTQLKELLVFGKFEPVVAAEHETVSKPVPDKVMDDMRSCYAAIIHVGKEIKLLDQEGNEHAFLNQNVLIEIGAAMALYNRRFILLVERGATLPSNLQGLYEVRYEGDKLDYDATMKLLRAFNEFKS